MLKALVEEAVSGEVGPGASRAGASPVTARFPVTRPRATNGDGGDGGGDGPEERWFEPDEK